MARLDYKSDISWGLRRGSERNGFTRLGSIGWLAFATKANAITHRISAPVSFFLFSSSSRLHCQQSVLGV